MKKSILFILTCYFTIIVVTGCVSTSKTYYSSTENQLNTRHGVLGDNGLYHDVLFDPSGVSLNFQGYIVGIDKSPREDVGCGAECQNIYSSHPQNGLKKLISRLKNEPKVHYVSHITKYFGRPYGDGNCQLYSIYEFNVKDAKNNYIPEKLINPCSKESSVSSPSNAFNASFDALNKLTYDIEQQLTSNDINTRYSHVVIVVMGWNTTQIEATRNFNSIAANIRKSSNQVFNPLFIGVTWSSYWSQSWLDSLVKLVSYHNKAHDADEIGATWLSLLIQRVSDITPNIPKVVIGHSFGARASSMAVCNGSVFKEGNVSSPYIDVLIGLQPAVSINRFITPNPQTAGLEDIIYPANCDKAKKIVLTASDSDEAVKSAFWADMVGNLDYYNRSCTSAEKYFTRSFHCKHVDGSGFFSSPTSLSEAALYYIDASSLISYNHPNTGGGSHSDIYRLEISRMIWEAIK
jgi:hypothetical protein